MIYSPENHLVVKTHQIAILAESASNQTVWRCVIAGCLIFWGVVISLIWGVL